MQNIKRCLVIEDDGVNARYIADSFEQHGYFTRICNDGESGLACILSQNWDLIILDRMLPNHIDGLSILKKIRSLGIRTPVLVLSALSGLDDRIGGLRAGGDDYLIKPFEVMELLARSEALIRRNTAQPKESSELVLGDLRVNLIGSSVERAGMAIQLQIREFKLLLYLLQYTNQVVTRSMLLEAVWGYKFDPQTNVIDVQISRLRNKLDKPFSYPLIHTVRGEGYMLSMTEPEG